MTSFILNFLLLNYFHPRSCQIAIHKKYVRVSTRIQLPLYLAGGLVLLGGQFAEQVVLLGLQQTFLAKGGRKAPTQEEDHLRQYEKRL